MWVAISSSWHECNCVWIILANFRQHFSCPNFNTETLIDTVALNSQGVLVDFDDFSVEQKFFDFGFDITKVVRDEEWSGEYGPDGKLSFTLIVA